MMLIHVPYIYMGYYLRMIDDCKPCVGYEVDFQSVLINISTHFDFKLKYTYFDIYHE
jgi:hypothetical protein